MSPSTLRRRNLSSWRRRVAWDHFLHPGDSCINRNCSGRGCTIVVLIITDIRKRNEPKTPRKPRTADSTKEKAICGVTGDSGTGAPLKLDEYDTRRFPYPDGPAATDLSHEDGEGESPRICLHSDGLVGGLGSHGGAGSVVSLESRSARQEFQDPATAFAMLDRGESGIGIIETLKDFGCASIWTAVWSIGRSPTITFTARERESTSGNARRPMEGTLVRPAAEP